MDIAWNRSSLSSFLKCLQSLPNLHTLEIGRVNNFPTTELKYALMGVELPQIKSLILPPAAHFLLRHCRHVEDVVCVTGDLDMSPGGFLISLSSKRDSKVKRLAISLVTWDNPSRKRFSTLWDYGMITVTDCPRPQGLWPRVQCSPNSPSSSLTYIGTNTGKRDSCSTRSTEHAPQYWIWSVRARRSQTSPRSRSHIFPSSHLLWYVRACGGNVIATGIPWKVNWSGI